LFSASWGQIAGQEFTSSVSLLARIYFEDLDQLNELVHSVDAWEVNHEEGYLVAYLEFSEYQELISNGIKAEIDNERTAQIQKDIIPLPDQTAGIPGYPCYRTVEETHTSMENLAAGYPGLADWIDIGDSWEKWSSGGSSGYDLHTLVLTNKSRPGPKPKFFLMAAIHAREYVTAELAARFAEYLVENYDQDADITWLLDYYEVHITPMTNPDGRKIAEGGIYWRKNVNNTDGCPYQQMQGTDLNRNSSFKWGLAGSSPDACAETFRGAAPASETETQAIQNYIRGIFADRRGPGDSDPAPADTAGVFITLHSYGDLIMFPWAWTDSAAPNGNALQTLGRKFGYYSGYQACQSGGVGCLYKSSGNSDDWAYGELGLPAYTFEIGTAFFESCSYFEEQILPEQFPTLLYAFKSSRLPYQNPSGPESLNLHLSAEHVAPGAGLVLSFNADDTRYYSPTRVPEPSQNIAAARLSIDAPAWESGNQPLNIQPEDGRVDSPIEAFSVNIDTRDLSLGRHALFVESKDADGNWGVPSSIFVSITEEQFKTQIQPDKRTASSSRSIAVAHDFEIINAGTQNDTFEIQLWGNTWPTSLSRTSVGPLIPGENTNLTVKVTIPESAQLGDQDLAALVITSTRDPEQYSQAQIKTTVREPMLFIPNITK
jgi:hypothetical protein